MKSVHRVSGNLLRKKKILNIGIYWIPLFFNGPLSGADNEFSL